MVQQWFKRARPVIVLRRRRLAILGAILAVIAIFYAISSPLFVGASATKRQLPIYSVRRENKVVSLSFDAAWGNEDTQTLIDIFDRYGIKVTFFVVGAWVEKYPESVLALHQAGHEVMNHSEDHAHFSKLSRQEIADNINACSDRIEALTGVRPTLFRPPYGEYDDHVIETVNGMGVLPIQWDVDSLDWKELPAEKIADRVLSRVGPGSIVLFHNAALHTPEALPTIIESLLQDGYAIVPISQILLKEEYTIDHTGRQIPAIG
jgi:peptidoglycan/xylan/chitin deacetylase (PgdA/CDA1 family)